MAEVAQSLHPANRGAVGSVDHQNGCRWRVRPPAPDRRWRSGRRFGPSGVASRARDQGTAFHWSVFLQIMGDPQRLGFGQQRSPGRHRGARNTVQNDPGQACGSAWASAAGVSGRPRPPFSVRPWHEPQSCCTMCSNALRAVRRHLGRAGQQASSSRTGRLRIVRHPGPSQASAVAAIAV